MIYFKKVELKNGDKLKGLLDNIDNYMNLKIIDVLYSAKDNSLKDYKINEIYVRGNNINSLYLQDGLLEKLEEKSELESLQTNIPRIIFNFVLF